MAYSASAKRYLTSIGQELAVQANRIRDLIGSTHWLSDGRHKESLVAGMLRRHLPAGVAIGSGFVVSASDHRVCSTEQDILIVDASEEAPLYYENGLLVAFPQSTIAAVSVKTRLDPEEYRDGQHGLEELRQVFRHDGVPGPSCASFFFELGEASSRDPARIYEYLAQTYKALSPTGGAIYGADWLFTPESLAIKCTCYTDAATGEQDTRAFAFDCDGAAAGLLAAVLADAVASHRSRPPLDISEYLTAAGIKPLPEPYRILRPVEVVST